MRGRHGRATQRRGGFTLLEVLLVVVILGMLASLVVPNFIGTEVRAKRDTAKAQVSAGGPLGNAIRLYRMQMGVFPESLEDLIKVPEEPEKRSMYGSTPMIEPDSLKDPWGNEYQYRLPGEINKDSYDVFSFGPDGKEGGEGDNEDIGNWTHVSYR